MGTFRQRAALAAAVGLIGFAALGVTVRTTPVRADAGSRAALNALLYLEAQQTVKDGSLAGGGFFDDDNYVMGAAAAGYDPNLLSNGGPSIVAYLSANAAAACPASTAASPSAGKCGALIQAALAAGANPRAFGGLDIVARLNAYYDPTTGRYGDGGAFTEALAIQGLVADGQSVPAAALALLHGAEDSDGGWDYLDIPDDPNAASNFNDVSDSNDTAMVLMALDAAGDHTRDSAGLGWLHSLQNTDGGFSLQGGASDPDSTALVLQAIVASGASPTAPAWTIGGHTPASELLATQGVTGGYVFPGSAGPDPSTTAQVVPALDGTAYPIPPASSLYVRGTSLPGPPPSPPPASPTPTSGVSAGVVTPPTTVGSGATAVSTPATGAAVDEQGFPGALAWALLAVGAAILLTELGRVIARR